MLPAQLDPDDNFSTISTILSTILLPGNVFTFSVMIGRADAASENKMFRTSRSVIIFTSVDLAILTERKDLKQRNAKKGK